jgi:DtxR family transcriptional regulator, Mn-dependent transcriptional regulator
MLPLAIALLALAILCWPRHGIIARYHQLQRLTRKERLENALKHLHHCEYSQLPTTRESLAGAVRISLHRATELAGHLEAAGLVTTRGGQLALTAAGRHEALRIVRSHRLWERYLAEFSGLDESLWHDYADRLEHTISPEEAEQLAVQLGYPRYDPHGAPIPTRDGDLPASRGEPLADLPLGSWGRIIHVEDEPRSTYEQLVTLGLTIGTTVSVVERSGETIRLEVDGEEISLPPVCVGNLSVERVDSVSARSRTARALSRLAPGEKARVIGLLPACRGIQRRRLLDLGLVPGTIVEAELRGSMGDPTAYRIRHALVALRRHQARFVLVDEVTDQKETPR